MQIRILQELGRRSAQQLAKEWPTLFMYETDIPRIQAYRPQKSSDLSEVLPTVQNLQHLIAAKEVVAANQLYDKLTTENKTIPREVMVSFPVSIQVLKSFSLRIKCQKANHLKMINSINLSW